MGRRRAAGLKIQNNEVQNNENTRGRVGVLGFGPAASGRPTSKKALVDNPRVVRIKAPTEEVM